MKRVKVNASTTYEVLIHDGLIGRAGEIIASELKRPEQAIVVTDDTVASLYSDRVLDSLGSSGIGTSMFSFPPGEQSKSFDTLVRLVERMAELRFTKTDAVVALGGGVVGDVAGFAAAVYARGIRCVQIPTTLMAAVDSSVGGKTAVNLNAGKNLAGVISQPSLVICDTGALKSLPGQLLADGRAEIIKYGVLAGESLFTGIESGRAEDNMEETVARCVSIKAEYVSEDERDEGRRQFLNLGHTFGHSIEKLSGYTISHGAAVGMGLSMMGRAAHHMKMADADCPRRIDAALAAAGLALSPPYTADEICGAALSDKKRRGGSITLIVPIAIGECRRINIPVSELGDWARAAMSDISY